MEPFVERIVVGGVALVLGLWIVELVDPAVGLWLLGPLLVFGGGASLVAGITGPLEWPRGS